MPFNIIGRRIRGDVPGLFASSFIVVVWIYCTYCTTVVVIPNSFEGEAEMYAQVGHSFLAFCTILSIIHGISSEAGKLHIVNSAGILGWEFCDQCQLYRPPRSHHCSRCSRCVRKMDHHCRWINNCVGEENNAIFLRLVFYVTLQSLIDFVLCCFFIFKWLPLCEECKENYTDLQLQALCMAIVTTMFGGFCAVLTADRILLITADVTTIELLKNKAAIRYGLKNPLRPSWLTQFHRAFGTGLPLLWFMPYYKGRITPSYELDGKGWQELI